MTLQDSIVYSGGLRLKVKIYYDDVNHREYICDASNGTALTTAAWKVRRIKKDTNERTTDIELAGGGEYDQPATSLAVVEALVFS